MATMSSFTWSKERGQRTCSITVISANSQTEEPSEVQYECVGCCEGFIFLCNCLLETLCHHQLACQPLLRLHIFAVVNPCSNKHLRRQQLVSVGRLITECTVQFSLPMYNLSIQNIAQVLLLLCVTLGSVLRCATSLALVPQANFPGLRLWISLMRHMM